MHQSNLSRWHPGLISRLKRRLRREDGQEMVELALALPILLLIIMGILYFGRFLNYSSQETQLAAQGARWAAVNANPGSPTALATYVQQQATGELLNGSSDVTHPVQVYIYYPTGSTGAVGQAVRVCVTATVQLIPLLGGTTAQIVQSATMRLEQTASAWTPQTPPSACPMS